MAGLSGTDNMFRIHPWDKILEQVQATLNMLIPSKNNLKITEHAMLEVTFDYKINPLAPPGTKVIVLGPVNSIHKNLLRIATLPEYEALWSP